MRFRAAHLVVRAKTTQMRGRARVARLKALGWA